MTLDIISYGEASRASRMLKSTQQKLGNDMLTHRDGVTSFDDLKSRIDALTDSVTSRYRLTDELAKQNAINILKANVQLSLIEQLHRTQGDSMVFDDLVNLSGIDTASSTHYTHSVATHSITINQSDGSIISVDEEISTARRVLVYNFGTSNNAVIYVSRKTINGVPSWIELPAKEGVYHFKESDITESNIRFMVKGPVGTILHYYGWVMA